MRPNELERICRELRLDKIKVLNSSDDTNIQFTCIWHSERRPSCGISASKEAGRCFSCGKTFHISELVMQALGVSFHKAMDWLEERVKINKQVANEVVLRRFDDVILKEDYEILPRFKLAPYQSGKVMHSYLAERGFTAQSVKDFMLGWDEELSRITIPIFDKENNLQGFIGRTVFNESDPEYFPLYGGTQKYKLYPPLKKSFSLFPIHKLKDSTDLILVEGTLDSIKAHQYGFSNTLSIINSSISDYQVRTIINLKPKSIIVALDNDKAGDAGNRKLYNVFKNDFKVYGVTYPEGKKDIGDMSKCEVEYMLSNLKHFNKIRLRSIT